MKKQNPAQSIFGLHPIIKGEVNIPKVDEQFVSLTGYDNFEFPNKNAIENSDHDLEEDLHNKTAIEKQLYYLSTDDIEDEQMNWSGKTKFQQFRDTCERRIPQCIPDAKVLKIVKMCHKTTGERYIMVDIRVLDAGAFTAPVLLAGIRDPEILIDNIVQKLIAHFIKLIQVKRMKIYKDVYAARQKAIEMDGPKDEDSIMTRALMILKNKI